jgi:hypothetical protein
MLMMDAKQAMTLLGRIGGQVKSPAKAAAARENGKLGGRPLQDTGRSLKGNSKSATASKKFPRRIH